MSVYKKVKHDSAAYQALNTDLTSSSIRVIMWVTTIIKEVNIMSNSAETIEKLARQLEQQKINAELQSCETLEDFKKLAEKYKAICEDQK